MNLKRDGEAAPVDRVMSNRAIWIGTILVLLTAVGTFALLQLFFSGPGAAPRLEALKTAGTLVVGTGGGVALWLAARRQRSTELTIRENARIAADTALDRTRDLAQRESLREDARLDAIERHLTELYTKASEQLGHDTAAVRLAGLYALERIADGNPAQRQTIVNVICAYLRMPLDIECDGDGYSSPNQQGEVEVRRTALDILTRGTSLSRRGAARWLEIELDLSRTHLFGVDFSEVQAEYLQFTGASFYESSRFSGSTLQPHVNFAGAKFYDPIVFEECTFGPATFQSVEFHDGVDFNDCRFKADAEFYSASFNGSTTLRRCSAYSLSLIGARFAGPLVLIGCEIQLIDLSDGRISHSAIIAAPKMQPRLEIARTQINVRLLNDPLFVGCDVEDGDDENTKVLTAKN